MNAALKNSLMIAGLMIASTTAFAQTFTAKVNFPFSAGKTAYPAAEYVFQVATLRGATPLVTIRNAAEKNSTMMISFPTDIHAETGSAKLLFECREQIGCALAQIRSTYGTAWKLPTRKATAAEAEHVAIVDVPLRIASR